MTILSVYVPPQYSGDGQTTNFSFPFGYFASADLAVTLFNGGGQAFVSPAPSLNGTGTYDFTVRGTLDPSGTGAYQSGVVVFNNAPPAGYTVTVYRAVAETQGDSLPNGSAVPGKTIEAALDRLTMIDQQVSATVSRALVVPAGDAGSAALTLPPAASRAGQWLGFDATGNATARSLPISAAMQPVVAAGSVPAALNLLGLQTAAPADTPTGWGYSPYWAIGGRMLARTESGAPPSQSAIFLTSQWNQRTNLPVDFAGAPGATVPYSHMAVETSGGSNLQAIVNSSLVVNNGSADSVAAAGRAYRLSGATSTTGMADACGVFGSAYNLSTTAGGTMGVEGALYNCATGSVATDCLNAAAACGWTVAGHFATASTGSPATAIIAMDGTGGQSGFYGAWNGLIIDHTVFSGTGIAGTVGINCGTWSATGLMPETGWKVGDATQHIWASSTAGGFKINAPGGLQVYGGAPANPTAPAGLQLYAGTGQNAYLDFHAPGLMANLGYMNKVGGTGMSALCIQDMPTSTPTILNRTSGQVFMGGAYGGQPGFTFGLANATDGYMVQYRADSTAVDGIVDWFSNYSATRANVARLQVNGNFLNINNSYGALSDERLKENIADARSYLDDLRKLKVKRFSLKAEKAEHPTQLGLIAQEVRTVFPGLVEEQQDGMLAVKYSVLVPMLLTAVQDLAARVAALEGPGQPNQR